MVFSAYPFSLFNSGFGFGFNQDVMVFRGTGATNRSFPAVLFLRCEQNDKNFQINGVYVVSSNTRMERRTNPYEVDLNGLIRLETKKEYTDRANKNVPVKMLDGTFRPLVLKIKGREVNITFPNPDQTQIQNLEN